MDKVLKKDNVIKGTSKRLPSSVLGEYNLLVSRIFLTLSAPQVNTGTSAECIDQDQTKQNVQSDL